jgi:regulator of cell morphogenesis and NO signaling
MVYTETTVARLVTERPGRSRVFEKMGIDYCCGGDRPLGGVCAEKGLDAEVVAGMLEAYDLGAGAGEQVDWSQASITELADHIEEVHHGYLREALPRLERLVERVAQVHGAEHPELVELCETFVALKADLEAHQLKEERVLFPMCREIDGERARPDPYRTVNDPIAVIVGEHEEAGVALARLRELAGDYEPPAGACNTWRAMLDGLAELERDTHLHIHKENHILFPKASAAEATLAGRQ